MTNKINRRLFYVVHCPELVSKGIDDYVCIPGSWLICKAFRSRVAFRYPNNDDPPVIKNRVRPKKEWGSYMGNIKYDSNIYKDCEDWIKKRHYNGHTEKAPKTKDTQPKPALDKKLRSANQTFCTDPTSEKTQFTAKPNENPGMPLPRLSISDPLTRKSVTNLDYKHKLGVTAKSGIVTDYASLGTGYSMQDRSLTIDYRSIQKGQANTISTSKSETYGGHNSQPVVSRPSSAANLIQQYEYLKLPRLPVRSTLCSNASMQDIERKSSVGVAYNHQWPRSQGTLNSTPSASHRESNRAILSSRLMKPKARKQSLVVKNLKQPLNKKTRLENSTKCNPSMHYPPNFMMQLSSHSGSAGMQTALPQNPLKQAEVDGSLLNNVRFKMEEKSIGQRVSLSQNNINTSAALNIVQLAHQYRSFVETPQERQYFPTQKDYFQQVAYIPNMQLAHQNRSFVETPQERQYFPTQEDYLQRVPYIQNMQLAHQNHSFVQTPQERKYFSTQEDYLQQIANIQNTLSKSTMAQSNDQRVYLRNDMMNGGFVTESQLNPIHQPSQILLSNENHYIPVNSAYVQKKIRHDLINKSVTKSHTTYNRNSPIGMNIQFAAHNSFKQFHQSSEQQQLIQNPPNYEDSCIQSAPINLSLKSPRCSHGPTYRGVNKRTPTLASSDIPSKELANAPRRLEPQDLSIQNEKLTEYHSMDPAVDLENHTVEPARTTQNADTQTMLSFDRSYQIQPGQLYLNPRTKKCVVDQATEMDLMMDTDQCLDEITKLPVVESAPRTVEVACQTDEKLPEKKGSLFRKSSSDYHTTTKCDIKSGHEVISETYQKNFPTVQNIISEDQVAESGIAAEQDMLNVFRSLITETGDTLSVTCDIFNRLQNSIVASVKKYDALIEQVRKFNSIMTLQIPTSSPN